MANVLIDEEYLKSMADAIRSKTGGTGLLTPSEMVETVEEFPIEPPTPVYDIPYGRIGYRPWTSERSLSGEMVDINSVDDTKLDQFLTQNPSGEPDMAAFTYEMDWESETPEENFVWQWYSSSGEVKIQPEDFTATTGIDCTLEEGTEYAEIRVEITYTVDTGEPLIYADFTSLEQFNAFANVAQSDEFTRIVGTDNIYNKAVEECILGGYITDIPNYFLYSCSEVVVFDTSRTQIQSIGSFFMSNCEKFNQPLDLSHCTSIAMNFMNGCDAFNQPLDISNVDPTQGELNPMTYFLSRCTSFNSTLTLPTLTEAPTGFLSECASFNKPLDFSQCTEIGSQVLARCRSFNQPLDISKCTKISEQFMLGCYDFNQPLNTSKVTSFGERFLATCSSFNQPISLASAQEIGVQFLSNCTAFNQDITVPAVTFKTTGNGESFFMYNCNSMTSTVTWESTTFPVKEDYNSFVTDKANAPCYTTGIKVTGAGATNLKSVWPNMSNSGYQKYRKWITV